MDGLWSVPETVVSHAPDLTAAGFDVYLRGSCFHTATMPGKIVQDIFCSICGCNDGSS